MSTRALTTHESGELWLREEHRGKVGMATFLCSEVAFFSTLIVAYVTYLGQSRSGPGPTPEVLELGLVLVNSACLLASSVTVLFAGRALARGSAEVAALWLALTIGLGGEFIVGTAYEWKGLIENHGLTIDRNMFGSTFFTLIGFHAFHVSLGLVCLTVMLVLYASRRLKADQTEPLEIVSWYWHFVDGVWIVIFSLVYVIGR